MEQNDVNLIKLEKDDFTPIMDIPNHPNAMLLSKAAQLRRRNQVKWSEAFLLLEYWQDSSVQAATEAEPDATGGHFGVKTFTKFQSNVAFGLFDLELRLFGRLAFLNGGTCSNPQCL
jgi:hypothetical protein